MGGASKRHYTAALIRRLEGGSTSLIRPSLDEMPSRSEPTGDATTASIRNPRPPRPSSPLHTVALWCGRGGQRHVRGVHKNGSQPGTLKPSASHSYHTGEESMSQAAMASSETGARNQNQPSMGDVVRPAPSRLISSAGGVLPWEGQVKGITQLH